MGIIRTTARGGDPIYQQIQTPQVQDLGQP
jgi:hypothetical protein